METVSEDSILLLIDIIQQYDFLYDLGHKDYKNINKKEQAWAEIAAVVSISVEECKRLWKNVRDRFTREERGQPSGAAAPESNWPYLKKKENIRPSSSSSTVSSVWSSVNMIMSPECDSPLQDVEETMTTDASVEVDDVQIPKASKGDISYFPSIVEPT
ncbi:hypothetical protein RI129_003664 [Pyrocoelia pectoralis]|uniref:MADF domain-containing protein n=1 Tax=Pyrocoelia pectoralis TaxID=417401 RepID=A0AAN7ZNA2_9COLE